MKLGKIESILLIGGARLLAEFAERLKQDKLQVVVVSSPRHLGEAVRRDGAILESVLARLSVPVLSAEDINREPRVDRYITDSTLGIAIGAAWVFEKPFVSKFKGRLLDFMGIRLPQFRGGAHYTWQILMKNRTGSCNLQVIEGGAESLHKGPVIKSHQYFFPPNCRIPRDYFDAAVPQEAQFLMEFLCDVQQEKSFEPIPLQEQFNSYYPFLSTQKQGFINWSWNTQEIESFICAFDEPYMGASTFLRGRRVFLKDAHAEYVDGLFHPFQVGLVYRVCNGAIYVVTREGSIVVRRMTDEKSQNVLASVTVGMRLFTPQSVLEEAMQYDAVYGASGLQGGI